MILTNPKIELALVEEMRQLIQKENVMSEILEVMDCDFMWLLRFCERNNITIPDRDRLLRAKLRLKSLLGSFYSDAPDESKQRDDFGLPDAEVTEPNPTNQCLNNRIQFMIHWWDGRTLWKEAQMSNVWCRIRL
jgi:hypothetical protein